jgi:hypothetical protein
MPRDSVDDRDYYLKRAHEERQMAALSSDASAAAIHLQMARCYDSMASRLSPYLPVSQAV